MLSLPSVVIEDGVEDSETEDDYSDADPLQLDSGLEENPNREKLSASEVALLMLDWMCTHKCTDASAEHMWSLISMMRPGELDRQTFGEVI